MRALLFLLLLANVAFFGWSQWLVPPAAVPAPVVTSHLPMLELASMPDPKSVHCRSLGPFMDASLATQAAGQLSKRGIVSRQREIEATVTDGYWVHIDLPDAATQHRAFARLVAAGIHDAALMTQADQSGRISVGIFSDQAHAVGRAEQVRALGFKPMLELHQRPGHEQWLDMYLPRAAPEPAVTDLIGADAAASQRDSQTQTAQFVDCPTGAPGGT